MENLLTVRGGHAKLSALWARFLGSTIALIVAIAMICLWIVCKLDHKVSMVLHQTLLEFTTMLTFLTVVLLQRKENKDVTAMQLKLDELISAVETADNKVMKAEDAPEHVLEEVQQKHAELL